MKHFFPLLFALNMDARAPPMARDNRDITVAVDARMSPPCVANSPNSTPSRAASARTALQRRQQRRASSTSSSPCSRPPRYRRRGDKGSAGDARALAGRHRHEFAQRPVAARPMLPSRRPMAPRLARLLCLRNPRCRFAGPRRGDISRRFVFPAKSARSRRIARRCSRRVGRRWRAWFTRDFSVGISRYFLRSDWNTYQRTTLVSLQGTNSGARFSPNGQQNGDGC